MITKRIQRKRLKGWRMPPETVYVGRPSKWGNPYGLGEYGRDGSIAEYASWLGRQMRADPHFLEPLYGKDLACWCREGEPCHADLLLKIVEMECRKASLRGQS